MAAPETAQPSDTDIEDLSDNQPIPAQGIFTAGDLGSDSQIDPAFTSSEELGGEESGARDVGITAESASAESSAATPTDGSSASITSNIEGVTTQTLASQSPADIENAVADAASETVLPMRGSKKRGAQRSPSAPVYQPGQRTRLHYHEDVTSQKWYAHKKHFFILSAAGKPIYSRYGDESKLSGFMGVIQAIVSFFAEEEDGIRQVLLPLCLR
ncbi:hypothetical protein HDU93_008099, partial [Gonapodya sp. JEL0774]